VGFSRHTYTSCSLCDKLVELEMAKSDERGKPVYEKCYANILEYPCTMSGYERESRWADVKLAAEKARKSRGAPRAGLARVLFDDLCIA